MTHLERSLYSALCAIGLLVFSVITFAYEPLRYGVKQHYISGFSQEITSTGTIAKTEEIGELLCREESIPEGLYFQARIDYSTEIGAGDCDVYFIESSAMRDMDHEVVPMVIGWVKER